MPFTIAAWHAAPARSFCTLISVGPKTASGCSIAAKAAATPAAEVGPKLGGVAHARFATRAAADSIRATRAPATLAAHSVRVCPAGVRPRAIRFAQPTNGCALATAIFVPARLSATMHRCSARDGPSART